VTVAPSAAARAKKAPADHQGSEPPFDVEAAAKAAAAEGAGEAFPFTLRGEAFTIPTQTDWPLEVSTLLTQNDLSGAIGLLLNGNFDRFLTVHPTMGEVNALFRGVAEWAGVDTLGN